MFTLERALGDELAHQDEISQLSSGMGDELTDEDVSRVRKLIHNSELRSIEFYEVSARRKDSPGEVSGDGNVEIEMQEHLDENSFGVRLNATVTLPDGEATADVAAEYDLLHSATLESRTLRMFANEVAVMTILPYVRETVSTITSKVFGNPVYLPIIERGEISVDVDGPDSP